MGDPLCSLASHLIAGLNIPSVVTIVMILVRVINYNIPGPRASSVSPLTKGDQGPTVTMNIVYDHKKI